MVHRRLFYIILICWMCLVSPVVISTKKIDVSFREIARLIDRNSYCEWPYKYCSIRVKLSVQFVKKKKNKTILVHGRHFSQLRMAGLHICTNYSLVYSDLSSKDRIYIRPRLEQRFCITTLFNLVHWVITASNRYEIVHHLQLPVWAISPGSTCFIDLCKQS